MAKIRKSEFLEGGGECGALIRSKNWSKTPLGEPEHWPQSLKTAVRIILTSRQPMFVWWGPQLINLYNDAYRDIVGGKHPAALGQPAAEVWSEIWDQIGPRARTAMIKNIGTYDEALLLIMRRHGYAEETYYTFSYSPIPGDSGSSEGILCANTDDTQRIIGKRQLSLLKELAASSTTARSPNQACRLSAAALETNPHDVPFALIYLYDRKANCLTLEGAAGIAAEHSLVSERIDLSKPDPWLLDVVIREDKPQYIDDVHKVFKDLPMGAWDRPPFGAVMVPIGRQGENSRSGAMIIGLNPFRLYDGSYKDFIKLLSGEVSANIASAQAYQEERKRAESLAELDRAKTDFFSNVSHEFRTPLTLMLGPLEDLLHNSDNAATSPAVVDQLQVAYRNGLRLQKLVNTLLDFSRIEAGRAQATYEPVNLGQFTVGLASNFRSVIEKAGMVLKLDIPTMSEPAYVDKEMWEKIVLNLLSNAFKYTLRGNIQVRLRELSNGFELTIKDTGIGIRKQELPRLFERFHRIQGAEARSNEGTGIGLSLVYELVKLLRGTISVASTFGKGTTFTVRLQKGTSHLPTDQVATKVAPLATHFDQHYLQEALRWQGGDGTVPSATPPLEPRAHILIADDNTDMRAYVAHLLQKQYQVSTVSDGQAAIDYLKQHQPDMLITDVMMPHLDGFGLLRRLRANPETDTLPVIMLSARAGDEARIESLDAGADDYLVKPFSARELLARVNVHLELSRVRRQAAEQAAKERTRLHGLFMQAPAAIAVLHGPDLVYELANPLYQIIFNRTKDQLLGKPLRQVFPEIKGQDIYVFMKQVYTTGKSYVANEFAATFERGAEGRMEQGFFNFVVEPIRGVDGDIDSIFVHAVEVTEQVQARKRVIESEQRLRFMAEAIPQMIFTIGPDGALSYFSPQWQRYTGVSMGKLIQDTKLRDKIVHPDDLHVAQKTWRHAFATGQALEYEYRLRRKDGVYRWHISRINPMRDPDGNIILWVGSNTDIDDMKRSTEKRHELEIKTAALTEQRSQLLALNQAKDEFISLASHQLRTPATGVKQYLGMMLQGYAGEITADQKMFLQTAYESNERQITIVNDLLQVARIDAGKVILHKESVDMVRVLKNVLSEQASRFADHQQDIVFKASQPRIMADIDSDRMHMVIDNVIDNASKYTEANKTIYVGIRLTKKAVVITIRDQGVGMDPSQIDKIFHKFSRLDNPLSEAAEGSGLGLYWAKKIIDLHDGTIEVTSAVGSGSTFTIKLPL